MPTAYNGIPGNVSAATPVAISSSTNTTPIVVTTAAAHGRTTGDVVSIYGHASNVAANGQRAVTVISSTTFSLNGSAGVAVGGATGTVDALAFAATFQLPSDGDAASAASVNTPLTAGADREAALIGAVGKHKLADLVHVTRGAGSLAVSFGSISTAAAFTDYSSTMGAELSLSNVHAGDFLEIDIATNVAGATVGKLYGLSLYVSNVAPGAAASFARANGSGRTWTQASAGFLPVAFKVWVPIGTSGTVQATIYGQTNNASADTITFYDDETIVARLWRPTFVPNQ